jgi:hypothetical protein
MSKPSHQTSSSEPPKYQPENWARWAPHTTISPNPFPTWAIWTHGILTSITCFLWSPIWLIHYLLHKPVKYTYKEWE